MKNELKLRDEYNNNSHLLKQEFLTCFILIALEKKILPISKRLKCA